MAQEMSERGAKHAFSRGVCPFLRRMPRQYITAERCNALNVPAVMNVHRGVSISLALVRSLPLLSQSPQVVPLRHLPHLYCCTFVLEALTQCSSSFLMPYRTQLEVITSSSLPSSTTLTFFSHFPPCFGDLVLCSAI